jgi:hypothetical protein
MDYRVYQAPFGSRNSLFSRGVHFTSLDTDSRTASIGISSKRRGLRLSSTLATRSLFHALLIFFVPAWRGNAAQALDAPHLRSENIPIQPTPITGCARVLTSETHRPGLTSFRVRLACDLKTLPSEDFQTGKERLKTVEGHTIERLMRPEP